MTMAQRDNHEFLLEHLARFFVTFFRRHFLPKKVRYSLMTALALSVTPFAGANAQQYSSIVAFGDSYADTGNIQNIMATIPAYASTLKDVNTLYPTGRFSGGTNYVDTLSSLYGISPANDALGGAQTGATNEYLGLPGFTYELQRFLAVDKVIAPNALVTLNIGGNDARDYYRYGTDTMSGVSSAAAASADNAIAGINTLIGAGAKTLVFTAGNVADLPETANPIYKDRVPLGSAYSQAYNDLMRQNLSKVAASGVRVEYVDLAVIESNIKANPSLYGLKYATTSPIPGNSAQVNEYLFYVDELHLTSAGFAIVAKYIANRLNAPATFASSCELGFGVADAFVDTMFDRLDLFNVATAKSSGASGTGSNSWAVFMHGNGAVSNRSSRDNSKGYHSDGLGTTLGIEYRLTSETMVGTAYSYNWSSTVGVDFSPKKLCNSLFFLIRCFENLKKVVPQNC